MQAATQARQSPLYFDLTISFFKSISIFHASLGENARLAQQAGDAEGQAYWAGLVGEVDAMIWQAVHTGFGYFQREAGYTRTGSHAHRADGLETGQWHEAGLAVAHWLQHTSRDGDMQLHVHSQIAHTCRTVMDGKWRAPDSLVLTSNGNHSIVGFGFGVDKPTVDENRTTYSFRANIPSTDPDAEPIVSSGGPGQIWMPGT